MMSDPAILMQVSKLQPAKGCRLSHKVLIGTHHKGGTVWLNTIFRLISRFHGLNYFAGDQAQLPKNFELFFQNHTCFDVKEINAPYRGLHLIRDPRDIIISGCFYHQKSEEEWLHHPRRAFGGLTYQQKINSYPSFDDKLLFEMENCGRESINDMAAWNYQQPEFMEMKYETLIADHGLFHFRKLFSFLGFPCEVMPSLLTIAYQQSLFSGRVVKNTHIRSGKVKQWQHHFKETHHRRFEALFGNILEKLSY